VLYRVLVLELVVRALAVVVEFLCHIAVAVRLAAHIAGVSGVAAVILHTGERHDVKPAAVSAMTMLLQAVQRVCRAELQLKQSVVSSASG
jgi:hypothetical protein